MFTFRLTLSPILTQPQAITIRCGSDRDSQHATHHQPSISSATMTRFRPCIDLHAGQVKQIVGGTLTTDTSSLRTNFTSSHPAAYYARLYRDTGAAGAHVIMLGPGNEEAARGALAEWPGGLQVGGGITDGNARTWIDAGAEKVCSSPRSLCHI